MCFSGFKQEHLSDFKKELNSAVIKDMRSNKDNISQAVLAVDICMKESEYFFSVLVLLKLVLLPSKMLPNCTNVFVNVTKTVLYYNRGAPVQRITWSEVTFTIKTH